MATLNENVARTKADFKAIKDELVNKGASISSETPTSQYANIIKEMSTGNSEEAYEQGRQDVIAESKYIPKTVIGKVISLTDVSEVAHKVKVYGDNQEVEVYGKNLLPYPYEYNNIYGTSYTIKGVTFTTNADGSIAVEGVNNGITVSQVQLAKSIELAVGKTYTLSMGTSNPNISARFQYTKAGSTGYSYATTYTHAEGNVINQIFLDVATGATVNETIYPIVYEKDTHQTITATPTGTEIPSMCPNMNFITYSDAEANLLVEYFSSFGMQTEYDRFWDGYQNHGNRREYGNAFAGAGWTDATFKPKYDIVVTNGGNLFLGSKITDIVKSLDECGVVLDTSKSTSLSYAMQGMSSKTFPLLDLSAITSATTNFLNSCSNLEYIVGIVCSEKNNFNNTGFGNCPKLTHVIFSGVIASDINLQWSKLLDDESLVSISVALCDLVFSGFGDGWGSRTLTLSAESIARLKELPYPPDDLSPEGTPYAEDGASCYTVIVSRKGWNIA